MHPVMFVSLGPGDPDLITLKGLKMLQQSDIIFCPSATDKAGNFTSRSKDILSKLDVLEDKIKLFHVPMSKDREQVLKDYESVAMQVHQFHLQGQKVCVVAEGDSGFYSSSQYINEKLAAIGVPTKRIEGIPAFISCATLANIHIVKQEEQLLVIPGKTTFDELSMHIQEGKSTVIMKPSQCKDIIKDLIISSSKDVEIHYFENVGVPNKEYYSKERKEILERQFPYFSLLIIRKQ